jgi:hypothetical protein
VCLGLKALGCGHGNLIPENIILEKDGIIKLSIFINLLIYLCFLLFFIANFCFYKVLKINNKKNSEKSDEITLYYYYYNFFII